MSETHHKGPSGVQKDGLIRSFLCFLRLSQKMILIGIIMGRYGTDPYFYGLEKTQKHMKFRDSAKNDRSLSTD